MRFSGGGPSDDSSRGRAWRWVRRFLALLGGLFAFVAAAFFVFAHSLDQTWLKRRLQGLVRTSVGVEIEYRAARTELLSGIEIEGLVVRSPAEVTWTPTA